MIMQIFVVIVEALLAVDELKEAHQRIEMARNIMTQYNIRNPLLLEYEVQYLYIAGRVAYE